MPSIFLGIKDYLGANLTNAIAIVEPLATLPISNNLRLPAKIYAKDGETLDLPTGSYRVQLRSNSVAVKGQMTVTASANLSAIFIENAGDPLPAGAIPISNVINLQTTLDILTTQVAAGGSSGTGLEKVQSFTQSDLTVSGLLVVLHNFGKAPESVRVLDENKNEIEPDEVQDNGITTTVINLFSIQPITGTWTVIIGG